MLHVTCYIVWVSGECRGLFEHGVCGESPGLRLYVGPDGNGTCGCSEATSITLVGRPLLTLTSRAGSGTRKGVIRNFTQLRLSVMKERF